MIRRLAAALLGLLALGACTTAQDSIGGELEFEKPETSVDYVTVLEGAPDEETAALIEESLGLFRFQDRGAQSVAFLRRRAEQDVDTVKKILRSRGWYEGTAETRIDLIAPEPGQGDEVVRDVESSAEAAARTDDPAVEAAAEGDAPETLNARAVVIVKPGRRFTLAEHRFIVIDQGEGAAPQVPPAAELGSPVGGPAEAAPILDAESAAVAALRRGGRPYAEFRGRRAVADMENAELVVESTIASGPFFRFGDLRIEGAEGVRRNYIRSYQTWEDGAPANPEELRAFQRDLMRTDLFENGTVRFPNDPPEGDVAPIIVTLEERPPRTITAGLSYSTDIGPEGNASYTHRNLFGENETLDVGLVLGLQEQSLAFGYREPQFPRPGQDLVAGLVAKHEDDDAYEQTAVTGTLGFEREVSERLTWGAGGLVEVSRVDDQGERQNVLLGGVPAFVRYDASDSELDPANGWRGEFYGTPFLGRIDDDIAPFLRLDGRATAYWDIMDDRRYVLAGRTRLGSIVSSDFDDVPAPRRLYSGGGGSVRGYADKFVGPLDDKGDPVGGRSVLELSGELRARVWGDIGAVGFVDAGSVSRSMYPDFANGMQVAAGIGARYYSPVGPIRLDVAVPLNPRDEDDAFQMYISIGQAY